MVTSRKRFDAMAAAQLSLPVVVAVAALSYGCNLLIDVSGYTDGDAGDGNKIDDAGLVDGGDASIDEKDAAPPPGASALKWATWRMPNGVGDASPSTTYTVNGNGSVYDTLTKLTWANAGAASSYDLARSACEGLKLGGTYRLPTRVELVSLLDFSGQNDAGIRIHPTTQLSLLPTYYWTQSYLPPPGDGTYTFWMVSFQTGAVEPRGTSNNGVLCVLDAS